MTYNEYARYFDEIGRENLYYKLIDNNATMLERNIKVQTNK